MSHPLAPATPTRVHAYSWPDPKWMDVSGIRQNAAKYGGRYAILGGDWSPFWHDAILEETPLENVLAMFDTITAG